ncbi:MAG: MmcQ/YjbR family DNA-binding protein [Chloroflexota bacterium]
MDIPLDILARLRSICLNLPEAYEELAWVGTRWCVRKKNFAHVLVIESGWPAAYAQAAGFDGTVLTFRAPPPLLDALRETGQPFFFPRWFPNIVGMRLSDITCWDHVAEHLTESYCVVAPKQLVSLIGVERS